MIKEMTLEEKLKAVLSGLIPLCGTANIEPRIEDILTICKQEIAEAKPKWISVKDRLPEASGELLLHTRASSTYVGFYKSHIKVFFCYGVDKKEIGDIDVAYWMPLPPSPEESV